MRCWLGEKYQGLFESAVFMCCLHQSRIFAAPFLGSKAYFPAPLTNHDGVFLSLCTFAPVASSTHFYHFHIYILFHTS